jgi:hypothetical protein
MKKIFHVSFNIEFENGVEVNENQTAYFVAESTELVNVAFENIFDYDDHNMAMIISFEVVPSIEDSSLQVYNINAADFDF